LVRRAAPFLALLALAAPIACGDNDNAFKEDYNQAVEPLSSLGDDVGQSLSRASGESNKELASRYNDLADRMKEVRGNLARLDPPDDAQDELDALVASLRKGTKNLRSLADAARSGDPAEAQDAAAALVRTGQEIQSAETDLQQAVDG
jgi:hypothetical protein